MTISSQEYNRIIAKGEARVQGNRDQITSSDLAKVNRYRSEQGYTTVLRFSNSKGWREDQPSKNLLTQSGAQQLSSESLAKSPNPQDLPATRTVSQTIQLRNAPPQKELTAKELLQEIKDKNIPLEQQRAYALSRSAEARRIDQQVQQETIYIAKKQTKIKESLIKGKYGFDLSGSPQINATYTERTEEAPIPYQQGTLIKTTSVKYGNEYKPQELSKTKQYISDRAFAIAEREEVANKRFKKQLDTFGMGGLIPDENDGKIKQTAKYLGLAGFSMTLGVVNTGERIALTTDKAIFRGELEYYNAKGELTPYQEQVLKEERQTAKKAAFNAISPVSKNEIGEFEYNPQGTANLLIAGTVAGFKAYSKVNNPIPKTKGGLHIKDVKLKGKQTVEGTTTGKPNPNLPTKQSYELKFNDPKSGILNTLRGKTVSTKITKTDSGTIVRVQQTGKNTYVKTILPEGAKRATIQVIKNGKVVQKTTIKASVAKSQLIKYENLAQVKANTQITKPQDNILIQKSSEQTAYNMRGELTSRGELKGSVRQETTAQSISVASPKKSVAGNTIQINKGSINKDVTFAAFKKNLEQGYTPLKPIKGNIVQINKDVTFAPLKSTIESVKLQISNNAQPTPRFETQNTPAHPNPYNLNMQQNSVVTTGFKYETNIYGEFSAVKYPFAALGKKGSLSSTPQTILQKPVVEVQALPLNQGISSFEIHNIVTNPQGAVIPFTNINSINENRSNNKQQTKPTNSFEIIPPKSKVSVESSINKKPVNEFNFLQDTKQPTQQTPLLKPSQGSKGKSEMIPETKPKQKNSVVIIPEFRPENETQTKREVITNIISKPKQTPFPRNIVTNLNTNIQIPQVTGIKVPSFSTNTPQTAKGYNVFAKVRGVFKKLNIDPLKKEEAINLGAYKVGRSSAASFKIEETGRSAKGSFNKKGRLEDFYNKKGTFIEKRSRRIKSRGELEEITFKGQAARRKKGVLNIF